MNNPTPAALALARELAHSPRFIEAGDHAIAEAARRIDAFAQDAIARAQAERVKLLLSQQNPTAQ